MMKKAGKGSITIWLSLVICVVTALAAACIWSARLSAARAYVSICMEESLFSEFARYDRILYDRYGLLAVDGGFGGSSIDFAAVAREIDTAADELISVNKDLFRLSLRQTDITGYVLATDSGAAPLKSQIAELMRVKLGVDGVNRLADMVGTNEPVIREQEETGSIDPESIRETYERQKEEAAALQEAAGAEGEEDNDGAAEETGLAEVPEDFKNPIDHIETIMRLGIYNTILPDPAALSNRSVDLSSLAERRVLQSGMGLLPEEEEGAAEHLLTAAYITDFFPNFLSKTGGEGLKYQAEFAVAGKGSDAENLKSVLNRLLLIRLGFNYLYLNFFDPGKKEEAEAVAFIIASILLAPEMTEPIAQTLLMAWAYGESMMDLKTLLAGGNEPVIKDASTWQLSLEQLAWFSHDTPTGHNRRGLSYKDHLILLMCMKSDDALTDRLLDLLEYNRQLLGSDPGFHIDSCITALETETFGTIDDYEFSIRRRYGYE